MNKNMPSANIHDTDEVYAKLNNLVSQPLRPVKHEKMQEFLGYFDDQCKRSKAINRRSQEIHPRRRAA